MMTFFPSIFALGMDEQNEEQVWKLLVETAENHSAQFLYMAPKYPSSLKFDKNMHIHTCFNGQFDLNEVNNRIQVDDIIEKLKLYPTLGRQNITSAE